MKAFKGLIQMGGGMFRGDYPDFVTKNRVGDELPVFTYHHVRAFDFERHLNHLQKNRYQTLTVQDLDEAFSSSKWSVDHSVILTFDDGLADLFTTAFPLLKKHGLKAVAFIAPFWIGRPGMITWDQVNEMHESGVIDFQSHSYSHGRIYSSSSVVDFVHPNLVCEPRWILPFDETASTDVLPEMPAFGMPVYTTVSCMSDDRKYLGDQETENLCTKTVCENGGEPFFQHPHWRKKLETVVRSGATNPPQDEQFESTKDQEIRVIHEIRESKRVIEEKIPGHKVTGFAYPFYEQSQIGDRLFEAESFQWIFGGITMHPSNQFQSHRPNFLRRIPGDYVMRLPGNDRASLLSLYINKGMRRLQSDRVY